ncbi:uncharacterized protein PG998_001130 [Apiospora kogelbergensis]|uniref:uncharacterized protein n=1 Tax=Apiospora kogelbergensis TaxID=1337665 RepID=UPI00312EF286
MARTKSTAAHTLPLPYRLFFLVIEPISALVGAYYAHFRKADYLALTHPPTAPPSNAIPAGTSIVLSQLANLYLLFALNEALVLRSTSDLFVWKTVLFVLLLADLGHLYSVAALGAGSTGTWRPGTPSTGEMSPLFTWEPRCASPSCLAWALEDRAR